MLIAVIVIALLFDFLNGFHDAANAIATIVITRTLTPGQAVIMAGLANCVGYFTLGTAIAKTIGKGVIHIDIIPPEHLLPLLFSALMGAVIWNIITWLFGLPTSSSHALIGGLLRFGSRIDGTAGNSTRKRVYGRTPSDSGFYRHSSLHRFYRLGFFHLLDIYHFPKS